MCCSVYIPAQCLCARMTELLYMDGIHIPPQRPIKVVEDHLTHTRSWGEDASTDKGPRTVEA